MSGLDPCLWYFDFQMEPVRAPAGTELIAELTNLLAIIVIEKVNIFDKSLCVSFHFQLKVIWPKIDFLLKNMRFYTIARVSQSLTK